MVKQITSFDFIKTYENGVPSTTNANIFQIKNLTIKEFVLFDMICEN